jgi:hypothetical protein
MRGVISFCLSYGTVSLYSKYGYDGAFGLFGLLHREANQEICKPLDGCGGCRKAKYGVDFGQA